MRLLHNLIRKSCPKIHSTRLASLVGAVEGVLHGRRLTLTGIGRSSVGKVQVKHKIKRIDRLIGNPHLHRELLSCYKALAELLIGNKKHPIILVDWSTVDNHNNFHVLKASVAYDGRAITIYDQVEYKDRPKKEFNNSHDQFVENLSKIFPENCKPIIVSDAAFIAKWFKRIEAKGWYWVGRLRGLVKMREPGADNWTTCQEMFTKATFTPQDLGEHTLSKKNPLSCHLYIYKNKKKGRKCKNKDGSIKKINVKKDYSRCNKEPWLLASNLPKSTQVAKKVVRCYQMRMQIEETFRDVKNHRYGIGIRETLSTTKERIAVLLLIGALALLVYGILGRVGYQSGMQMSFQASTIKNKRVLSFWFLGQQIYEHARLSIPIYIFEEGLKMIIEEIPTYELL